MKIFFGSATDHIDEKISPTLKKFLGPPLNLGRYLLKIFDGTGGDGDGMLWTMAGVALWLCWEVEDEGRIDNKGSVLINKARRKLNFIINK